MHMSAIGTGAAAEWRASPFPAPADDELGRTLCQSVVATAEKYPDRPALIDAGRQIGFRELVGRAGALADEIRACGAPPGPAALMLSSGTDATAAWFACAAAGRPLLMLELRNPPERNRALIAQAGAGLIVHDGNAAALAVADACAALRVAPHAAARPLASGAGLGVDEPALIFPTSGSTGQPKLIAYSSRTMQAKVQASIQIMRAQPGDVVLIAGSHTNYGFMHHALVFLFAGGCVCLTDIQADGLAGMFAAILAHDVRHMRFTPSMFRAAVAHPAAHKALRSLKAVRFSGEPLLRTDIDLARAHLSPDCLIQNVYGSTESALFVWSSDRDELRPGELAPIGRIYPLSEFQLRGDDGEPATGAEMGELVISSPYHALGDWRQGEIDASRFPPDPRGGGRRLYFTGDAVRPSAAGGLVMLGRKDRLVKINGQRVSLMELENHLRELPNCANAAVFERRGPRGTTLAAFLAPADKAQGLGDPRAWLAARLPPYMIPGRFETVAEMQLLPGGKVDGERLLASLPPDAPAENGDPASRYGDLAVFWRRLLATPNAAPDDDFFRLGGDSLKFLELEFAVERDFGKRLDRNAFLNRPTLETLARILKVGAAPIPAPHLAKPASPITFRLVQRAAGKSLGVALGMPDFHGRGEGEGLVKAGALGAFDVWTCDIAWSNGNMLTENRWLTAAGKIAERLKEEGDLRPRLLFGFSIAGFVAWMTDRALNDVEWRPRRLLCLDAPAMHRRTRIPTAAMGEPAEMFHLRRAVPPDFGLVWFNARGWEKEDAKIASLEFRTIEHMDFHRAFGVPSGPIDLFAAGGLAALSPEMKPVCVPSDGGRLFDLLSGVQRPDPDEIAAMARRTSVYDNQNLPLALQYLVIAVCSREVAIAFITRLLALAPIRKVAQYALERLRDFATGPNDDAMGLSSAASADWRPANAKPIQLETKEAIDHALAARRMNGLD